MTRKVLSILFGLVLPAAAAAQGVAPVPPVPVPPPMVLTPADPYSMLLMAIPLCLLYVVGILMCKWMPKGRNPFAEAYEP